jgi:hypothetical protein
MPESASDHPRPNGTVTYERPLDQAVPASAWRAILADDEPVTLETSPAQLIRAIRDSASD